MNRYTKLFAEELENYFNISYSYSGRSMYGDTCVSVTMGRDDARLGDVLEAIFEIGINLGGVENPGEEDLKLVNAIDEILRSASMDSMGTGTVLYFPAANTVGIKRENYSDEDDEGTDWTDD